MDEEKGITESKEHLLLNQDIKHEANSVSQHQTSSSPALTPRFWSNAIVNTLATAAIVFTNKQIFSHPRLRHAQVTFAAFHFLLTFLALYLASSPLLATLLHHPILARLHLTSPKASPPTPLFPRKSAPLPLIAPIAAAMILNVVLPNAALAHSSIQFYQVARVLVTPAIVAINAVWYRTGVAREAVVPLVAVCVGVGVVSYFDTAGGKKDGGGGTTSLLGVGFALTGVLSTAVYTVWVKTFGKKLECNSSQLLMNQAPVSVLFMLYVIPFVDDITAWEGVESSVWFLVGLSGVMACLINISQFIIIEEAGPVTSSVVGHFKTCFIVALSWIISHKTLTPGTVVGVLLALGGIIAYSHVTQKQAAR